MFNTFFLFITSECFCYQVTSQGQTRYSVPVCGSQNLLNLRHLDVFLSVSLDHLITRLDKTGLAASRKTHLVDSDKSSLESIEAGGVQHLLLDGRGVRAPTEQEYLGLALTKYFY